MSNCIYYYASVGCRVLWCTRVCLWTDLHEILCANPLWPWLGPPTAALHYVMYFCFMDDVTFGRNELYGVAWPAWAATRRQLHVLPGWSLMSMNALLLTYYKKLVRPCCIVHDVAVVVTCGYVVSCLVNCWAGHHGTASQHWDMRVYVCRSCTEWCSGIRLGIQWPRYLFVNI